MPIINGVGIPLCVPSYMRIAWSCIGPPTLHHSVLYSQHIRQDELHSNTYQPCRMIRITKLDPRAYLHNCSIAFTYCRHVSIPGSAQRRNDIDRNATRESVEFLHFNPANLSTLTNPRQRLQQPVTPRNCPSPVKTNLYPRLWDRSSSLAYNHTLAIDEHDIHDTVTIDLVALAPGHNSQPRSHSLHDFKRVLKLRCAPAGSLYKASVLFPNISTFLSRWIG